MKYYDLCVIIEKKELKKMIKFTVKVMLAKREMTQKELAEKTGIRPPTISAICTGSVKHLPVDALDKICAVLDCQPADIMEYIKSDVQ
ncbi:MAG: helix-turn-helix domain-containing protein [Hominilimicola sp.]|uniref:helix-turn-helix domain-containing protein n=1 Tax=Hominilimicola sp. TaxID=3073571 RepID=UPI003993814D